MRSIFIIFCLISGFSQAQVRGKVIDATTSAPLKSVNAFINHTTLGGVTDAEGNFVINNIPLGEYELVVSVEGYKPYRRKLIIKDENAVYTTLKILKDVASNVPSPKTPLRDQQLKRFSRLLFGSGHLNECSIVNPQVLEFTTEEGLLIAKASEPLELVNDYLGYRIHFLLNDFELDSTGYALTGDTWLRPGDRPQSVANRLSSYAGSAQHFFKSVIADKVEENGFKVYVDRTASSQITRSPEFSYNLTKLISPYSMRGHTQPTTATGIYRVQFPPRIEVHYIYKNASEDVYRNISHPVSWIDVNGGSLRITSEGTVIDAANLFVRGNMGNTGLGSALPQDYIPAPAELEKILTSGSQAIDKSVPLLEKPYLHTDRSYYYNSEKIWFKGYISYASRFAKDTLSQSLYVDLVNAANEVQVADVFRIENGIVTGDLQIPTKLPKGDYVLKAYTSWTLNFGDKFVFTKPIKLLAFEESVRLQSDFKITSDSSNVVIHTDKTTYHPREKITVSLATLDANGFRTGSDLSVSVTDLEQAVPGPEERTIMNDFRLTTLNDAVVASGSYPIEYGIDFKGNFLVKGKGEKGTVSIFQEKVPGVIGFGTDDRGAFRQSLQLYDSTNLFLQARNLKGKPGTVVVDPTHPMPQGGNFPRLRVDVYAAQKQSVIHSSIFAQATMLQEVTIRNKRIERTPSAAVVQGKGDYSLSGDWIRENDMPDLLQAITYKIPGVRSNPLRVGWFADEPLVLMDGVVLNQVGVDVGEMIRSIPARSVERVEVIKYATGSVYGARGASGVIAIYSRKGEPDAMPGTTFDKSKLQLVKVKGFARPSIFESPDYGSGTADRDLKDYRATIYWNPSARPTAKGPAVVSFYAADLATSYRIVVEGILIDGTPVRAEKLISVKGNP